MNAPLAFDPPISLRRYLDAGGDLDASGISLEQLAEWAVADRLGASTTQRREWAADTRDLLGKVALGEFADPTLRDPTRIRGWAWSAELHCDDRLCERVEALLPGCLVARERSGRDAGN